MKYFTAVTILLYDGSYAIPTCNSELLHFDFMEQHLLLTGPAEPFSPVIQANNCNKHCVWDTGSWDWSSWIPGAPTTLLQFQSLAVRHQLIPPAFGRGGQIEPWPRQGLFTFLFTSLCLHCIAHFMCVKWYLHSQLKASNLNQFQQFNLRIRIKMYKICHMQLLAAAFSYSVLSTRQLATILLTWLLRTLLLVLDEEE